MDAAPECWGKFNRCGRPCEFAAACRYCTETESRMNRPLYGQDYDSVSEWAPDLADYRHIPGEEQEALPEEHNAADLAGFLNFLLHLDNYTLGILAEIIAPSSDRKRFTVAELARIHGISRQGMHRKLLDVARKSPELASLLAMTVRKIRRARQEFTSPCVRTEAIRAGESTRFRGYDNRTLFVEHPVRSAKYYEKSNFSETLIEKDGEQ